MTEGAGLYIHVPFCSAICPYCDFAVQRGHAEAENNYLKALTDEVQLWKDWSNPFDTIYLGGGTPSLVDVARWQEVLATLRSTLPFDNEPRLFFEANPEDVTRESVAAWKQLGVSFLSLGVQSFDDRELKFLGRRHTGAQATTAVQTCLAGGFDTVSIDLMFGLPAQSEAALSASLDTLQGLAPQHVSCYQLTVHDGTPFGRWRDRGKLTELEEDAQAGHFELVYAKLADGGWDAYEVSNFSRGVQHRSAHNQKYWRHVPYLGLGPSAHSFDGQNRWWNVAGLEDYCGHVARGTRPIEASERLSPAELALEAVMLMLRTADGIALRQFEAVHGIDLVEMNRPLVERLEDEGLLEFDTDRLALTRAGFAIADGLVARLELGV